MSEYPNKKNNCTNQKYRFNIDNETKKALLSLSNKSIFLKNIIKNKEKQKTSNKKLFEMCSEERKKRFGKLKIHDQSPYERSEIIYQSPINTTKTERIQKEDYNNKPYENNYSNYSKNSEFHFYKTNLTSKINNKRNNYIYYKLPNNISYKSFQGKNNTQNKSSIDDKDNRRTEIDKHVISIQGHKMFTNSSFSGLNNKAMYNSPISNHINDNTELFRNYIKLKLKKEEIYKRKNKKDISSEQNENFIKKDKEIKEKNFNYITDNNDKSKIQVLNSYYKDSNYKNKIPIQKKDIKYNIKKNFIIKRNNNNSKMIYSYISSQDNVNTRNLSKNIIKIMNKCNNLSYSRDNNIYNNNTDKSRNSYILKRKKNDISNYTNFNTMYKSFKYNFYSLKNHRNYNNVINNTEINKSSNNIQKKNIILNCIESNMNKKLNTKSKNKMFTPEKNTNPYKFVSSRKQFLEDQLNNRILFSHDKKLTIRIHCLRNINQEFIFKRKKAPKLCIKKANDFFLIGNKLSNLNYSMFRKISKTTINKNILSSIKEEEKSRAELTKSESQLEELDNSYYAKKKVKKYLN